MKTSGRRMPAAGAAATMTVGVMAVLTGCVPLPFACPAIGWSNGLTVELEGDTSEVASVQLCTDDGCAPGSDADPSGPLGEVVLAERDGDTWAFSVGMTSMDRVTVRALAGDGSVISDTEVTPEWVRVGGDDRCGGPTSATVTIDL